MQTSRLNHRRLASRFPSLVLASALATGVVAVAHTAGAQEEVVVDVQPPAPRAEVIPRSPGPRFFWVQGYYGWRSGAHYWIPGRYELIRPGWSWSSPHWAPLGHRWHFYSGHWYR